MSNDQRIARRAFLEGLGISVSAASMSATLSLADVALGETDLLEAIRRAPGDDAPRLAYADWLASQAHPMAELVRLQCDRAHHSPIDPEYYDLAFREYRLLCRERTGRDSNFSRWLKEVDGKLPKCLMLVGDFERGLLEEIWVDELDGDDFLDSAEALFENSPGLQTIEFSDLEDPSFFESVFELRGLEQLRSLRFLECALEDEGMRRLAACRRLKNLEDVQFYKCNLGAQGLQRLVTTKALEGLRSLELHLDDDDAEDSEEAAILVGSPLFSRLTSLTLNWVTLNDAVVDRWIARSPAFERLWLLDVAMSEASFARLLSSRAVDGLRELHLKLAPAFADALATCDWSGLGSLRRLILHADEAGTVALAKTIPPGLADLDMRGTCGDAGADAIARSSNLGDLRILGLGSNGIGPEGAAALGRSSTLDKLVNLSLAYNPIGPEGACGLVSGSLCRSLRCLKLQTCDLGDEGAKALGNAEALRNLLWLNLDHNDIDAEGGMAIAESLYLASLIALRVNDNHLDDAILDRLRAKFGPHAVGRFGSLI